MKVLVAEDDRVSRKVLNRHLTRWEYDTFLAEDGDIAWQALKSNEFHLAILDWNMPGLNGIELCRKIRAEPGLQHLYIILLTGRNERKDLVMGFEAGADDYVIKPFDPVELSSRMKVGCRLVDYQLQLKKNNEQLNRYASEMETLAEERSKMLIHADRLASLGTLTAGIAHEINNPNTFISGNAQTLDRIWPVIETALTNELARSPESNRKINLVLSEYPKMISGIRNGVTRVTNIVKGLKTFARVGKNTTERFSVNHCMEQGLMICSNKLKYLMKVEQDFAPGLPTVEGDPQKLEQVFVNLFVNAADAHEETRRGRMGELVLRTRREDDWIIIEVEDDGPGIPETKLADIWKPFFTTKDAGKGTGLGLAISQGIVHDHQGEITVENMPGRGARFTIRLPIPEGAAA
ncbi:MAG: response regulator [Acidobacteriota bacterium]|nr:response regulator [Acidobacteriota bacterium]